MKAGMGGISGAGGVPFYGQPQQPKPAAGGFTYGGIGGAGGFMSGVPPSNSGGGGFTYGMASAGGSLFGPPSTIGSGSNPLTGGTQFGASSASSQNPGLFQFGKVSTFGGVGGAGAFTAGSSAGLFGSSSVPVDDPYANIAIDLNKVKKSEPPVKLHELKTEEEKKKEAEQKKASAGTTGKSNLKKEYEEKKKDKKDLRQDEDDKPKRNVTFGKSTTYEVEIGETDESNEFINKDNAGGKGSPRPSDKKVIEEKDLGDGRSEKEKILEMLERQQREQLEEIASLNQIQNKTANNVEEIADKSNSASIPKKVEPPNKTQIENSNSYESDDFEDISASGSGSKSKLNYWPGKNSFKKQD